jgi:signal transduction histidine kinase
VDFPEKPPEQALAGEDRHNLYLVVKESLNNVVKHAHASEVWLRAQVTPEHLSLSIEDNGQGLDPSAREAWEDGLRNMRQRLAAIGGSVEIRSAAQQGTTVLIRFPWPRR